MNKYHNINEIGREQAVELGLGKSFFSCLMKLKRAMESPENEGILSGKDFLDITEADLKKARLHYFGEITIQKVAWLQRYFKGEVSGVFEKREKTEDEKMAPIRNHIKILEKRIEKLKEENNSLKNEIAELRKQQKKVLSVKNKILEIAKGIDE